RERQDTDWRKARLSPRSLALSLQAAAHERAVGLATLGAGVGLFVFPFDGAVLHLLLLRGQLLLFTLSDRPAPPGQKCGRERRRQNTFHHHRIPPWITATFLQYRMGRTMAGSWPR